MKLTFIKKYIDYIIISLTVILLSVVPITLFVIKTFKYVNTYGSERLGFMEYWDYSLTQTFGMWLFVFSPVIIIIVSTVKSHKMIVEENLVIEEYDETKTDRIRTIVKDSWLKAILVLMVPTLIALIASLVAPTSRESTQYFVGVNAFAYFVTVNINRILFSLLFANIALIACRFFKKYIFVLLSSIFMFVFLTFGLTAAGGAIEEVIQGDFNLDWLNIYSPIFLESRLSYLFQFIFIFVLFSISFVVLIFGYKGNKNLTE